MGRRASTDVDKLSIEITANAQSASQALNTLCGDITNLSNALKGTDLNKFSSDLKNMGNAFKGVNAKGLTTQMQKLSTATQSYRNSTEKMKNQTAQTSGVFNVLASGTNKLYSGLTRLNSKINEYFSRIRTANKETKNFAQTVGLLYARFFLLIRGVKGLANQVKKSMSYIEVLNYFESSFGQVAQNAVGQWSEMGYDSAQAYYDSFQERAKKVTADMSGFFPEADGTLTPTGMSSLGMNPQDLIKYQTQFAQMSSSMGTTSEQALKLSEVLTKIGSDLASVKDMDFDQVWGDMASGLVGMSRTLDKYGVNIRNANMEAKLHELGINANVTALSQADKALLRTIILLDSTRYAWGDLSETLNTPANQFRMLANNVKLLGQMIGNILLPVVAKVLPYLNAFVIVLQRLFTWLAKILGIDLSKLMANNKGLDNSGISDLLDDAENLSDALGDDADNAKKLKKQLQGFDALNNLTTNDSKSGALDASGISGLLDGAFNDAVEEYLKAWEDAFKELENKAEALADKIQAFLLDLFDPLIKAWDVYGDYVIGWWKKAVKSIGRLLSTIGNDFLEVWHQDDTEKIFEHILHSIGNIGRTVDILAIKFRHAWKEGEKGKHIFENIRNVFLKISEHWDNISNSIVEWARNINFNPILKSIEELTSSLVPVVDKLYGVLEDFINQVLLPLGKWTIEEGLPRLIDVFSDFAKKVDWEKLRAKLSELWEHLEPFAERVGEGLIIFLERISDTLADWVNNGGFEKFIDHFEKFLDRTSAEDVADLLESLTKGLIALKAVIAVFPIFKGLGEFIIFASQLKKAFGTSTIANIIKTSNAFNFLKTTFSGLVTSFSGGTTGLIGAIEAFATMNTMDLGVIFGAGTVAEIGATIGVGLAEAIIVAIKGFGVGKKLGTILSGDKEMYDSFKFMGEGGFFDKIFGNIGESDNKIKTIRDDFVDMKNAWSEMLMGEDTPSWLKVLTGSVMPLSNLTLEIEDNKNRLGQLKDKFVETLDSGQLSEKAYNAGNSLTNGLREGIENKIQDVGNAMSSVSNTMYYALYESGLREKIKSVGEYSLLDLINAVKSKATSLYEPMKQIASNMVKGFTQNVSTLYTSIQNVCTNAVNTLKSRATSFYNVGVNLIRGLINGIISGAKSVYSTVSSVASNVINTFKTKWQIHSPSRIMDEIGVFFMQGFQNGMEGMYKPIEKSLGKFSGDLVSAPSIGSDLGLDGNNANIKSVSSQEFTADSSETNALLRQQNSLLQAILEKDMGISEGALFKSVRKSAIAYEKMNGSKAFA